MKHSLCSAFAGFAMLATGSAPAFAKLAFDAPYADFQTALKSLAHSPAQQAVEKTEKLQALLTPLALYSYANMNVYPIGVQSYLPVNGMAFKDLPQNMRTASAQRFSAQLEREHPNVWAMFEKDADQNGTRDDFYEWLLGSFLSHMNTNLIFSNGTDKFCMFNMPREKQEVPDAEAALDAIITAHNCNTSYPALKTRNTRAFRPKAIIKALTSAREGGIRESEIDAYVIDKLTSTNTGIELFIAWYAGLAHSAASDAQVLKIEERVGLTLTKIMDAPDTQQVRLLVSIARADKGVESALAHAFLHNQPASMFEGIGMGNYSPKQAMHGFVLREDASRARKPANAPAAKGRTKAAPKLAPAAK